MTAEIGQALALLFGHVIAVRLVGRCDGVEPCGRARFEFVHLCSRVPDLIMVLDRIASFFGRTYVVRAASDLEQFGIEEAFLRQRMRVEQDAKSRPESLQSRTI